MVNSIQVGAITIVALCALVAGFAINHTIDTFPEADVALKRASAPSSLDDTLSLLHISYSFYDTKLYEGVEFKVKITNLNSQPVSGANVSFIRPSIFGYTDKDGYVLFTVPYISKASAPHIRIEYITAPGDTNYTFPLSVKKEGYMNTTKMVKVYIHP